MSVASSSADFKEETLPKLFTHHCVSYSNNLNDADASYNAETSDDAEYSSKAISSDNAESSRDAELSHFGL